MAMTSCDGTFGGGAASGGLWLVVDACDGGRDWPNAAAAWDDTLGMTVVTESAAGFACTTFWRLA